MEQTFSTFRQGFRKGAATAIREPQIKYNPHSTRVYQAPSRDVRLLHVPRPPRPPRDIFSAIWRPRSSPVYIMGNRYRCLDTGKQIDLSITTIISEIDEYVSVGHIFVRLRPYRPSPLRLAQPHLSLDDSQEPLRPGSDELRWWDGEGSFGGAWQSRTRTQPTH